MAKRSASKGQQGAQGQQGAGDATGAAGGGPAPDPAAAPRGTGRARTRKPKAQTPPPVKAPSTRRPRSRKASPQAGPEPEVLPPEEPPALPEPEVLAAEVVGEVPGEPGGPARPGAARPRQELPVDDAVEGIAIQEEAAEPDLQELIEGERASRLPVPVGRDLTNADPLQRYLAEIARHPLLSREEEHELAVKFKSTLDPALAWRLVTANLRLVVKIAMEYRRAAFSVLDLIQEGNVGLMQAVQKYDPFRGVKLSSYAAWWIRAYILRYLMDNWRMVKLGTTQAQRKLFFNLRKEQEKLLAQGFEAAPKLLAEKLEVSEQDVREMDQRLGNDEFSIDAPVAGGDESRTGYVDRLVEVRAGADDRLGDEELRRAFVHHLAAFGETLTDERDVFLFHHRIAVPEGEEPMTLQVVGERYGFTRERARQLEARLTSQLREYLRQRLPDFAELSVEDPDLHPRPRNGPSTPGDDG